MRFLYLIWEIMLCSFQGIINIIYHYVTFLYIIRSKETKKSVEKKVFNKYIYLFSFYSYSILLFSELSLNWKE